MIIVSSLRKLLKEKVEMQNDLQNNSNSVKIYMLKEEDGKKLERLEGNTNH